MALSDFTTSILVDQSPEETFKAINNVRGWWSESIEGSTDHDKARFDYHYEDVHHCQMEIIEFTPNKKVVWYVKQNYFKFTQDTSEWTGTKISFEISRKDDKTLVVFTHHGLNPQEECYEVCRDSWTNYIGHSLYELITLGQGKPNAKGAPRTDNERRLGSVQ